MMLIMTMMMVSSLLEVTRDYNMSEEMVSRCSPVMRAGVCEPDGQTSSEGQGLGQHG